MNDSNTYLSVAQSMINYAQQALISERQEIATALTVRASEHRAIAQTTPDDETRLTAIMFGAAYDEIARYVLARNGAQ